MTNKIKSYIFARIYRNVSTQNVRDAMFLISALAMQTWRKYDALFFMTLLEVTLA